MEHLPACVRSFVSVLETSNFANVKSYLFIGRCTKHRTVCTQYSFAVHVACNKYVVHLVLTYLNYNITLNGIRYPQFPYYFATCFFSPTVNVTLLEPNQTLSLSDYDGSNVTLPCRANLNGEVRWVYVQSVNAPQHVIFSNNSVEPNYRGKVSLDGLPGDYSLSLHNVQLNESGWYICIEDSSKYPVYLDILGW